MVMPIGFSRLFFHLFFLAIVLLALQAVALYVLGQPAICECGYIKFWEGIVRSAGTSQHLTDWYTYSHIIHGILFYALYSLLFPRLPITTRFLLAIGTEVTWETVENTTMVIDKYREQALAQGYVGDSIINSLCDTLVMVIGFLTAWRLPVRASVTAVLFFELFVGYSIRDNLTLNILNFIYIFPFIDTWQQGG